MECSLFMQDKTEKNCYWCQEFGPTFTQCKERNQSPHSGPRTQGKAYKCGCPMPVKKLNAVEIDKLEEKRYGEISKNKENTSQKSEDNFELKDDKKI